MSDYFEGLSNKVKNRYKEKLQAVGLGVQDDPYKPENGSRHKTSTSAAELISAAGQSICGIPL